MNPTPFTPRPYAPEYIQYHNAMLRYGLLAQADIYLPPRIDAIRYYGAKWEQGELIRPWAFMGATWATHHKTDSAHNN